MLNMHNKLKVLNVQVLNVHNAQTLNALSSYELVLKALETFASNGYHDYATTI